MHCSLSARVGLACVTDEAPSWFWDSARLIIDTAFYPEADHCLVSASMYSTEFDPQEELQEMDLKISDYARNYENTAS